jgi:hypothetical protein
MPRMVVYEESELFPFPRERVWKLLQAHLDDATVGRIHPLIKGQTTVSKNGPDTVLQRTIDARGKLLNSQWKITQRPPDFFRFEVLAGEGPWSDGSSVESHYSEAPGGTLIQSRMNLHIKVLPFLLPQGRFARGVLDDIDREDRAYLSQMP